MSTSIINNVFESFTVRTVIIEGDPWFIAKDVAEALGYKDTSQAVRNHCKRSVNIDLNNRASIQRGIIPAGNPTAKAIPESDVYRLISRSRLPSAERFDDWVNEVVLPSLAKHGGYSVGQETLTPEMQEIINVQHKATALATACMSGVVKSHFINKEDREKIFKVLMTVAHTCVTLDSLWSFERDAAGALARVGMGHHVKSIPLNMAKAQDDKWIHAKKNSLQVQRHNAEGNGWG